MMRNLVNISPKLSSSKNTVVSLGTPAFYSSGYRASIPIWVPHGKQTQTANSDYRHTGNEKQGSHFTTAGLFALIFLASRCFFVTQTILESFKLCVSPFSS